MSYFRPLILLNIFSFFFLVFRLPWSVLEHGKWAIRDSSHLIELWWIYPSLFLALIIPKKDFLKAVYRLINCFTIFTAIRVIFRHQLSFIMIKGVQRDIPLLADMSAVPILCFISLYLNVALRQYLVKSKWISTLMITINLIILLVHQSRYVYIGLGLSFLFYWLFFSRDKIIPLYKGLGFFGILSIIGTVDIFSSISRFKGVKISVGNILDHLLTSFGGNSAVFSGAGGGGLGKE